MMKTKAFAMVSVILLVLSLASSLIQSVKASGNVWWEYWHSGRYQNYPGYPYNISTTATIYSADYDYWVKVALVVSVCEYEPYDPYDMVHFKLVLYFDSFAQEGLQPVAASFVTFFIDKDDSGSNLNDQAIEVRRSSNIHPGFSQGYGLKQSISDSSDYNDRAFWALDALGFAVGLFYEPVGVATSLISLAHGYTSLISGADYQDADWSDTRAYCWWHNPGYDFGYVNPVRQYAFNTIDWFQKYTVNPDTYYGLKVWARVGLTDPSTNPIGEYIDMEPVLLRIYHSDGGNGGGCPTLFVWNGSNYVNFGVINIHNPTGEDVVKEVPIPSKSVGVHNHKAYFRLREGWEGLNYSHSEIDQVKLYAVINGNQYLCPLIKATHSEQGNVWLKLLRSDDRKVDIYLMETIDLKFAVPYPSQTIESFIFIIEGCNLEKYW